MVQVQGNCCRILMNGLNGWTAKKLSVRNDYKQEKNKVNEQVHYT